MKTHAKLNLLIHNLKSIGIEKTNFNGTISLSNLNTDIHFFNSFNQTIVAIETLSPKVTTRNNASILKTLFNERKNINLPKAIKDTSTFEEFKTQLKIPFLIIENPNFNIRMSIYDNIGNNILSGGIFKLLAVHSKKYNLKPKKYNSFYKQEQTVFDIITSIVICRTFGEQTQDERGYSFVWNGYRLGTKTIPNSTIENITTFFTEIGKKSSLRFKRQKQLPHHLQVLAKIFFVKYGV